MDREKVTKGVESCIKMGRLGVENCRELNCPYFENGLRLSCWLDVLADALALLKEQENLLKEYEKLSQVCFKIEKYLRIADLSILIDRIEEGKVEVLQDDGRPDSNETTIKIRRM